jgi:hypothetical protein
MATIQIKAICSNKGLHFTKEYIHNIAVDVAEEIMLRFNTKPDWNVDRNFIETIRLGCVKHLFDKRYYKNDTNMVYLDDFNPDKQDFFSNEVPEVISVEDKYIIDHDTASFIDNLKEASKHYDLIVTDAQAVEFPFFIRRVCQYHSINWMRSYIHDLKRLWEYYHDKKEVKPLEH